MGNRLAAKVFLGSVFLTGTAYAQDADGDGVIDSVDNCRLTANPLHMYSINEAGCSRGV